MYKSVVAISLNFDVRFIDTCFTLCVFLKFCVQDSPNKFFISNVIAVAETSKNEDLGISVKVADAKVDRPSNLCCYSQEICNLEKLKGFDFCHKHILEDKASPFKPCDFVAKSNERRCPNPAPKLPNRGKR